MNKNERTSFAKPAEHPAQRANIYLQIAKDKKAALEIKGLLLGGTKSLSQMLWKVLP
jgi:hypothetical protein